MWVVVQISIRKKSFNYALKWKAWLLYTIFDVFYSLKDQYFPKFVRELDKDNFYFQKIYEFFIKRVTGGFFDYYCILPKEKKRSSSQYVLRHNIFDIKFICKEILKDLDFSLFTGYETPSNTVNIIYEYLYANEQYIKYYLKIKIIVKIISILK